MDESVKIPIQLQVTDLEMGNVDSKKIADSLKSTMSEVKGMLDRFTKNAKSADIVSPRMEAGLKKLSAGYAELSVAQSKYLAAVSKASSGKGTNEEANEAAKKLVDTYNKLIAKYEQVEEYKKHEDALNSLYNDRVQILKELALELKIYKDATLKHSDTMTDDQWAKVDAEVKATSASMRTLLAELREAVKTGEAFKLGTSKEDIADFKQFLQSINGQISGNQSAIRGAQTGKPGASENMVNDLTMLKQMETSLAVIQEAYNRLNASPNIQDKLEAQQMLPSMESLTQSIETLTNDIFGLNTAMEDTSASTAGVIELSGDMASASIEAGKLSGVLEDIKKLLEDLGVTAKNIDLKVDTGSSMETTRENTKQTDDEFKKLHQTILSTRTALQMVGLSGSSMLGFIINSVDMLSTSFANAASSAQMIIPVVGVILGAVTRVGSFAMNILTKIVNLLKTLVSRLMEVAKYLGGVFTSALKKVSSIFGGISSNVDSMKPKLKDLLRMFTQYFLGFRSAYFLIRRIRSTIIEGLKDIAAQAPEFNEIMSAFTTALAQVKGSLVSAFQPVVAYVVPALTMLLQMLNKVMVALAKFFAVLTGQGYYYDYTANMQDYANSIKGVGKAAKEARKDLMGFDEINRLSAPNDPSGGGGGLDGVFTKTPLDKLDAISKFAEMVKQAWREGGDFTEVGNYVGQNLSNLLDTFNNDLLPKVDEFGTKISKSVATFINGFTEVDGLGEKIGTTLANVGNTITGWINTFLTETHWDSLGTFVGDAINGAFLNFDWSQLFITISNFFNAMFEFIYNVASTVKWWEIGVKIASGLRDGLNNLDAAQIGQAVHEAVAGIFDLFIGFIDTMDLKDSNGKTGWQILGEKIAEFFDNLDTKDLGYKLGYVVSGIISGLAEIIENANFDDAASNFADGFSDGMSKHDWLGALKTLWNKVIYPKLQALWKWVKPILSSVFKTVVKWLFTEAIPGAITEVDTVLVEEAFKGIFEKVAEVVTDPFGTLFGDGGSFFGSADLGNDIGTWIGEQLGDFSGIAGVGQNIGESIRGAIEDPLSDIGSWFDTNVVSPITTAITNIKDAVLEILGDMYDGAQEIFNDIGDWFGERWEDITNAFSDVGTWFEENFGDAWDDIVGIFEGIGQWFSDRWDDITEVFKDVGGWFSEKFSEAWSNIESAFSSVGSFFQGVFDDIKGIFSTIGDEIGSAVSTAFQSAINWVLEKAIGLVNGFIDSLNLAIDVINLIPGVSLSKIDRLDVPQLAKGAVLPPNQPFLAMVGDQKSGTNIEAPLDTIKQAVAEVMDEQLEGMMAGFEAVVQAIQNKDMSVKIGDKDIYTANHAYEQRLSIMRGGI